MRIKVPHYDRRRNAFFHRDSALAGRRHYPSHRRGVALEPTRLQRLPTPPKGHARIRVRVLGLDRRAHMRGAERGYARRGRGGVR